MVSTLDTADGVAAYVAALTITAAASLLLTGFIALRARQLPGGPLLAIFLAGVAVWSLAQALPAVQGPAAGPLVAALIALSPLPAAAFVHLVFAYALCGMLRPVAWASYSIAAAATACGLILGVGTVMPWHGFPGMFVPSWTGWGVLGVAAILSIAGHLRLAQVWRTQQGPQGRQAGAVFVSSGIGLFALTGFAFPALGIDAYPWPVLALPFYSVALVYGILRHRFMAVNLWARRALVWLMLVGLSGTVAAALAALPLALLDRPSGWIGGWAALTVTLALGIALLAPLKRLANRIVFPGGRIGEADLERWRQQLAEPVEIDTLKVLANALLAARVGITPDPDAPRLRIAGETAILEGWDEAPPVTRHVAERFAGLVSAAAGRVGTAQRLVEAERERQQSARMVELGQLAATVAHDLRNPLGIVKMAATGAPVKFGGRSTSRWRAWTTSSPTFSTIPRPGRWRRPLCCSPISSPKPVWRSMSMMKSSWMSIGAPCSGCSATSSTMRVRPEAVLQFLRRRARRSSWTYATMVRACRRTSPTVCSARSCREGHRAQASASPSLPGSWRRMAEPWRSPTGRDGLRVFA